MLSNRITAKRRALNPASHANARMKNVSKLFQPPGFHIADRMSCRTTKSASAMMREYNFRFNATHARSPNQNIASVAWSQPCNSRGLCNMMKSACLFLFFFPCCFSVFFFFFIVAVGCCCFLKHSHEMDHLNHDIRTERKYWDMIYLFSSSFFLPFRSQP